MRDVTPDVTDLVSQLRDRDDCVVALPNGVPNVEDGLLLPDDLATFYEICGGILIGRSRMQIVEPARFVPVNTVVLGERFPDDPSDAWYLIAETDSSATAERVSLDLRRSHLGRCYDSFWDRHGVAGSTRILSTSFTYLLEQLSTFGVAELPTLGDAYD